MARLRGICVVAPQWFASWPAYVKRWRLSLAADHLADPDLTIGRIASLAGYQSPFTFSAAFKAHFGVSPSDYRAVLER